MTRATTLIIAIDPPAVAYLFLVGRNRQLHSMEKEAL